MNSVGGEGENAAAPQVPESRDPAGHLSHAVADALVVVVVIVLAGFGLYCVFRRLAETMSGDLLRYTLRADGDLYSDSVIRPAVEANWVALLIYSLLFGVCSALTYLAAYSKFGRRIGRVMGAALVVGGCADAAASGLILWSLHPPQGAPLGWLPGSFWRYAPAALCTLKWCALAIAVLSVPAAVSAVARLTFAVLSCWPHRRDGNQRNWCADVLPDEKCPVNGEPDPEAAWRRAYWVPGRRQGDTNDRMALCLSGGGVRSACVAMGVMQTLSRGEAGPKLDDFDYIISVSGGGYSAGARLLSVQPEDPSTPSAAASLGSFFGAGSPEFALLRRRSSYLADSPAALLSALGTVFKNLLASLSMVFAVAVALGWVVGAALANAPIATLLPIVDVRHVAVAQSHLESSKANLGAALAAVAVPLVTSLVLKCVALALEWASAGKVATKLQNQFAAAARGAGWFAVLVVLVTAALPALSWFGSYLVRGQGHGAGIAAGLSGVVVIHFLASVLVMAWQKRDEAAGIAMRLKAFLPAGLVQIGVVMLTLLLLAAAWLFVLGMVMAWTLASIVGDEAPTLQLPHGSGLFIALMVLLTVLSCVDVTSLSLHPFYRRRLARTFAMRREGDAAVPYPAEEATWLDVYGRAAGDKPEFVFACAAAISDDDVRPAPGLNAVSFVMGAHHIGGPALGWLKTSELRRAAPPRIQRDLTVQAAVAVSGAAFASAMGRQSKGIQTLLALSGARLGTWLPNPRFVEAQGENDRRGVLRRSLPSVRGAGYFYRELLGIHHADARLVQITDGGHYENLGLVEALRRKCRLIYCIDAGGDTPPLLSGLDDAIRLAEFELGVQITFESHTSDTSDTFSSTNLSSGTGPKYPVGHPFYSLNNRMSAAAVARATIVYPEASGMGDLLARTGCLIVAKAVLWPDLPEWVLTYAAGAEGQPFPHDNTFDQWFNEPQFASYTELGRQMGARALTVTPTAAVQAPT